MKKPSFGIIFNCIVLIKSLEPSEEFTTNIVHEGIRGNDKFSENPMRIIEYQVNNAGEFLELIEKLTLDSKNGLRPVINVDCHGDVIDGLEFLNGSMISWKQLSDCLTPLNEATEFNLIAIFSACYGAHFIGNVGAIDPAPCAFVLAPTHEIYPDELIAGLRAFYNALFDTLDMIETVKRTYAQTLQSGTWFAEFAATWYINVVTSYVKNQCTKKESRNRLQNLHATLKAGGFTDGVKANSMGQLKKQLLNSNRTKLTNEYFDRYFMLDKLPNNKNKYEPLRASVEQRLSELRASGKYFL